MVPDHNRVTSWTSTNETVSTRRCSHEHNLCLAHVSLPGRSEACARTPSKLGARGGGRWAEWSAMRLLRARTVDEGVAEDTWFSSLEGGECSMASEFRRGRDSTMVAGSMV